MKNRLSLFGFFGFLGFLGLLTDNPGCYGFFGFFAFFGFINILPDELFIQNVNKAAKNAFFTGMFIFPVIVLIGAFTSFSSAYIIGFAVNFFVQMWVFSISLTRYEKSGAQYGDR